MHTQSELASVAGQFRVYGELRGVEPYGNGHINDTYCAVYGQAGTAVRYILQRINPRVFKQPAALMANIQRVTAHLGAKLAGQPEASRSVLTLVPARDGGAWCQDAAGCYWRAYLFIEQARSCEAVQSPQQAFEAAKAFGRFQKLLADLPAPRLHETVPDFHDTPKRFANFVRALEADRCNRARLASAEIAWALRRQPLTRTLLDAGLPERVTHNDTKLNNVLLDDATGAGVCVIDLDTVMPGLALYDFGDLVRTGTCAAPEDHRNLAEVGLQLPMFEALLRGYLASAGEFLTPAERRHLAVAGAVITLEACLRFLTDFLEGDVYFKIHRDGHNLDRCRTQIRLVESLEAQSDAMQRLVEQLAT